MSIEARFGGECADCDQPIKPGQQITSDLVDDAHVWRHETCPDPARTEHPVCPDCWLTHAEGACDR